MPPTAKDSEQTAYLIVRQGGRWTDVFRLSPGTRVVIGRSSQSQIVIRSDQCSRAHAEISDRDGEWIVRDLGSRNGTLVDGHRIDGPHRMREGESVGIAGCQMTFARNIGDAFSVGPASVSEGTGAGAGAGADDSRTMDPVDPTIITARQAHTAYLESTGRGPLPLPDAGLFRIAFDLARSRSPEQAAEIALAALTSATSVSSGAVLIAARQTDTEGGRATASGMTALATGCRPQRSYRRLPDKIADTVMSCGEAILARNISDDLALASPDSRGHWSTTSTLCAPIRIEQENVGIIHIYSTDGEPELTSERLEFALAIAANLGLALEQLWRERRLTHHLRRSQAQIAQLRRQLGDASQMVGRSKPIVEIQRLVERAAPTAATVLVRGESGVGKELVAAAIHYASPRRDAPFVCLNCAALSPSLLESELFGHEKGAFTGATERKIGKFEAADGGTLMLDEIGEMNPEMQAKFLRVLEGQAFERVGGNTPIKVDVRVIAATNRDLEEAVRQGQFRSDLFFRLHVLELRVPPLRERGQDVILLAEFFLDRFRQETGRRLEGFTEAARNKLLGYHWPGNIRELKNTIERAVVLGPGPQIDADDIWLSDLRLPGEPTAPGNTTAAHPSREPQKSSPRTLAELEQRHIESVMRHTAGNKSQASRILGIERSTLDRKLKRLDS